VEKHVLADAVRAALDFAHLLALGFENLSEP